MPGKQPIVIVLEGGLIRYVYTDQPVILIDRDVDGVDEDDENLVIADVDYGSGRTCPQAAIVTRYLADDPAEFRGSVACTQAYAAGLVDTDGKLVT